MKKILKFVAIFSALTLWTPAAGQSLRVMSINAKESGAVDNYDYRGFAEAIKSYDPDIIALQEIDDSTSRNQNQDWLALLANELNMTYYYGKAFAYQGGSYGVGILSKYPFCEAHTARSTVSSIETRSCGWVTVVLPTGESVRVGSLHLSVSATNNAQVQNFADFTTAIFNTDATTPMLLIGDFNALPDSSTMDYVRINWKDLGSSSGASTYPVTSPTSRIDYIVGYPKTWSATTYNVVSHPDLSDHCFIVADVVYNQ